MDREQYEKELKQRQEEHLKRVSLNKLNQWKPCFHDSCPQCHGTGLKLDGSFCVHNIYCDCPKCVITV